MFQTKKVKPKFSFIIPGFFYEENTQPLRSQLLNLNNQTNLNFEVIILDLHYSKRNLEIKNICDNLKYNVIYGPYLPNTKIGKIFDYSILNNLALLTNSDMIVVCQEWRYFHPNFIELLMPYKNENYIGFDWQIFTKEDFGQTGNNVVNVSFDEARMTYNTGIYPSNINPHVSFRNIFNMWGHFCMSKKLWLDLGGIDEVATNLKHYADLDLNQRLANYYNSKNIKIHYPFFKNVCLRMSHHKGPYLGGSKEPLDYKYNTNHKKCCTQNIILPAVSDKDFTEFVVNKINNGEYDKLFTQNYDQSIHSLVRPYELDRIHGVIGFQCKKCKLTGETPHWYDKIPYSRTKALIGIGLDNFKLGRNLTRLNKDISKCTTLHDKINLLKISWDDKKYLTE